MYLHLGNDFVVKENNIIGIFDIENTTVAKSTRNFLANTQKNNQVINISELDLPKSFCVCEENGKTLVYISPISAVTLKKRIGMISE